MTFKPISKQYWNNWSYIAHWIVLFVNICVGFFIIFLILKFWNRRSERLIKARRPTLVVLFGSLNAILSIIIEPILILTDLANEYWWLSHSQSRITVMIAFLIEVFYESLVTVILAIILIRCWLLYYDHKFAQACVDLNWRMAINRDENNFWLKYRRTFGNVYHLMRVLILFSFVVPLICLTVSYYRQIINAKLITIVIRFFFGLPMTICMVMILRRLKDFSLVDEFFLAHEMQMLAIVIILDFIRIVLCNVAHHIWHTDNWIRFASDILLPLILTYVQTIWVLKSGDKRMHKMSVSAFLSSEGIGIANDRRINMIDVLIAHNGFEYFMRHCMKELSVESLLFIVEVLQFKETLAHFKLVDAGLRKIQVNVFDNPEANFSLILDPALSSKQQSMRRVMSYSRNNPSLTSMNKSLSLQVARSDPTANNSSTTPSGNTRMAMKGLFTYSKASFIDGRGVMKISVPAPPGAATPPPGASPSADVTPETVQLAAPAIHPLQRLQYNSNAVDVDEPVILDDVVELEDKSSFDDTPLSQPPHPKFQRGPTSNKDMSEKPVLILDDSTLHSAAPDSAVPMFTSDSRAPPSDPSETPIIDSDSETMSDQLSIIDAKGRQITSKPIPKPRKHLASLDDMMDAGEPCKKFVDIKISVGSTPETTSTPPAGLPNRLNLETNNSSSATQNSPRPSLNRKLTLDSLIASLTPKMSAQASENRCNQIQEFQENILKRKWMPISEYLSPHHSKFVLDKRTPTSEPDIELTYTRTNTQWDGIVGIQDSNTMPDTSPYCGLAASSNSSISNHRSTLTPHLKLPMHQPYASQSFHNATEEKHEKSHTSTSDNPSHPKKGLQSKHESTKIVITKQWICEFAQHLFYKYIDESTADLCVNISSLARLHLKAVLNQSIDNISDTVTNNAFAMEAILFPPPETENTDPSKLTNVPDKHTLVATYLYHIFDTAVDEVWRMLRDDTWVRFRKTEAFIRFIQEKQKMEHKQERNHRKTPFLNTPPHHNNRHERENRDNILIGV